MLGAIIGDIVGAPYEGRGRKIKTKDFPFFGPYSQFTDDSVCTAAVADILMHDKPPAQTMQRWGRQYPRRGYGGNFGKWLYSADAEPYNSWGNGSAMRVSPAAFLNKDSLSNALEASDKVTRITHNHPEGMKGARAATHAIWLAFNDADPVEIRSEIVSIYGYDLSRSVDEIRPDYSFDVSCQGTVPPAITCALESTSFEDAVRSAVSLGGDSDTLAAIAGPIAEALHGMPRGIATEAERRLLDALDRPLDILEAMRMMYVLHDQ